MAINSPILQTKKDSASSPEDIRLRRMLEMSDDESSIAPLDVRAPAKPRRRFNLSRTTLLIAALAIGLVVVSLTLGWLLGSMNQPALAPWQSSPAYERMYVTWVAERYAKTGDAAQAQRDLAGPRREYIADLLTTMQKETNDTQKRQQLAALGNLMRPPPSETSFLPTLVAQPVFVISLLLSFTPLLAAIGLVALPYLQSLRKRQAGEEELVTAEEPSEAALEELLTDVQLDDPTAQSPIDAAQAEAAANEEENKKEEEEEEEKQDDQNGGLGDLASLFEEEDTSLSALEAFCKGMVDVNVDALLTQAKGLVSSIKDGIARRA